MLSSPSIARQARAATRVPARQRGSLVCRASASISGQTDRRALMMGVLSFATAAALQPGKALAEGAPEPVYFGNGCFWGRQKDFVQTELELGRKPEQVSAVTGYAGGAGVGPGGKVCYYYADPRTQYERLGHAEVVSVELSPGDQAKARTEFKMFAETYFKQFKKTNRGMSRSDPQDEGAGYRNVVGLPGGVDSPFFPILKEANKYGMELRAGQGNEPGRLREDDLFNVVWVVDSSKLPFFRAEQYHQFHNGLGKKFSPDYTKNLKGQVAATGRIDSTGCPEWPL